MEYHRTSEKYHAKSGDSSSSGQAGGRPAGDRAAAQRKELRRGGGGGAADAFSPRDLKILMGMGRWNNTNNLKILSVFDMLIS